MKSIHIYTKNCTERHRYIFRIFFDDYFNIHGQQDTYTQSRGYKISYSNEPIPGSNLHIVPDGLLQSRIMLPETEYPSTASWNPEELPAGTDIFGLAFFILTRMEEYDSPYTDTHGRFLPEKSILAGRMHIPWIDVWRELLWTKVLEDVPGALFNKPEFRILPTFDIDHAYAYKGKGFLRNAGGLCLDLLRGRMKSLRLRLRFFSSGKDPYDTYAYISRQLRIHKQRAVFFILCGERNPPYDTPVPLHSRAYRTLLQEIRSIGETGLHPSYASQEDAGILKAEYKRLQEMLPSAVSSSRQHFLRIYWPATYRRLIETGVTRDYTMGYASVTGFRAGTCRPYPWFDLEANLESRLYIYPFSCMDGTLNEYLKLSPEQAIRTALELRDITRRYNGCFVMLWHNHSLNEEGHWKGWRSVFEAMISK